MSILKQKTLKKEIYLSGVGLHSGKNVNIKLIPQKPNTGIYFKRVDLNSNNIIYPSVFNVSSASYCTKISNEYGVSVSTIEHLMAALYGKGVDNLLIEIDSEEVPILDGSSKNFVDAINFAGFEISDQPIKIIIINKEVVYEEGEKSISFKPSKISLEIDFEINFKNELINTQKNNINIYMDDLSDMYNSRTFCLYEDIEKLKNLNLAKGGSLDNAIVVKHNKILNKEKLRNKKEFVNHKILDCLGDLYLSGFKMVGKITSCQGGHNITNLGLRKLLSKNENFSIIELKEKNIPHSFLNKNILKSIA
ncbi:UDP-3-O-acyl-N-acetylglucosamine deacetylase [Candidatus Pelagibacter sp.]|nr:UDP-3-O-acyl-N-acetylglucosamine deacetylase [Candidatus Pelagibacter sp.]